MYFLMYNFEITSDYLISESAHFVNKHSKHLTRNQFLKSRQTEKNQHSFQHIFFLSNLYYILK